MCELKSCSVETSITYPVADVTATQWAEKEFCVTEVAAELTGFAGRSNNACAGEFPEAPLALTTLTRLYYVVPGTNPAMIVVRTLPTENGDPVIVELKS